MVSLALKFSHPKYSDEELCASISKILNDNILSSIATIREGTSYICTAYFCFNSSLDLYFFSEPTTQHCKNLESNPSVAVAICDSSQPWDNPKRGLQLFGTSRRAAGLEVEEALRRYLARFVGLGKWIKVVTDFDKGILNSRFYRISVNSIKLFDEITFGPENYITIEVRR
jgi:uncharacterized protein YhbP (UPF0306 family)